MRSLSSWSAAVIVVTACSGAAACSSATGDLGPESAPLAASATIRVDSFGLRTLVATVAVANRSTVGQAIAWADDCEGNGTVDVRISSGAKLLWSSARLPSTPLCPSNAVHDTIAAGDTGRFDERVPLATIMGDSIAAGVYSIAAAPIVTSLSTPALTSPIALGQMLIANPIVVPPGTSLDGVWSGATAGLAVSLSLQFTADSAFGSGTFSSPSPFAFGCAGGSIAGATGPATLLATRSGDVLFGRLLFDTGYGPPFTAHLRSADSLDMTMTTTDTPSCSLSLRRE